VKADGDDRTIVVTVRDHGPGIAEENLGRIFDRFFTYRPEERRKHTGLGLSIVKHIIQLHGGRAEAESEIGRGTTVRLILPVVTQT